MSLFDLAINPTLEREGLFSDDPIDPGGTTNYGISLRWLRSIGHDVDGDGDVDADDIRALTRTEAIELYRKHFWNPLYEKLGPQLSAKVFDTAVNMGSRPAHRILQRALNYAGHHHLAVDGVLGSATINAAALEDPWEVLREYRALQAVRYAQLVLKNGVLAKYIHGWMRRAVG